MQPADMLLKKEEIIFQQLLEFYDEPRPHFNTLSTIVRGLEEKGFLHHEVFGNAYHIVTGKQIGRAHV